MKKPRDLDAELQALQQRAKALKGRRVSQFGELMIATGADKLDMNVLAGALLAATKADTNIREGWRRTGADFFQSQGRTASKPASNVESVPPNGGGTSPT